MSELARPNPMDVKRSRAAIDLPRFGWLLAQLGILLLVIWQLRVGNDDFLRAAIVATIAFAVHYFTPFGLKKAAFVALSLVGGVALMALKEDTILRSSIIAGLNVALIVLVGLAFYFLLRLPIAYRYRLLLVVALAALLTYWRTRLFFLPENGWTILGAIFMFRLIIYCYEVKNARAPERLIDFLGYFFILPNFVFLLFPIIDYATFKKTHYVDDIHRTAQRGIDWMVRGVVHLILYRIIYHNLPIAPHDVHSVPTLLQYIFPTFLLYLQVSGQFHFIVGMLHLFGHKLPETNRKYLLADSFTDFWRRINIYWRDFMVKCFYYPLYFRLRKRSELAALVLSTLMVFVVTTVLHGWQKFWLGGQYYYVPGDSVTWQDALFWGSLGVLVLANVLVESRRKPTLEKPAGAWPIVKRVLCTIGVYVTISVLWSAWSATSLEDWWAAMTYWM